MVAVSASVVASSVAIVLCSAPAHLLCYSGLLGMQLWQSFIVTKICFRALPKSAFTALQARIFPAYFKAQSLLLLLTALTFPPYGPVSLMQSKLDWIPFSVAVLTAGLNFVLYGPRTRRLMLERNQKAPTEGSNLLDEELPATDKSSLKRQFSRNHAMSIHLNLLCMIATLWHGWRFASKFQA